MERADAIVSIVDDDAAVRLAMGGLVRSFGWRVCLFESAEAFLRSDRCAATDLLISDMQMPGLSGIALQDHLIAQGRVPPILFVTAFENGATHRQALKNGAIAVLGKPVEGRVIGEYLEQVLGSLL
jgi:FixJ family two-component response regulator